MRGEGEVGEEERGRGKRGERRGEGGGRKEGEEGVVSHGSPPLYKTLATCTYMYMYMYMYM